MLIVRSSSSSSSGGGGGAGFEFSLESYFGSGDFLSLEVGFMVFGRLHRFGIAEPERQTMTNDFDD